MEDNVAGMLASKTSEDGTPIEKLTPGSEKKVRLACDTCDAVTVTTFHNYQISQKRRGYDGKTECRACSTARTAKARTNEPWNKGRKLPPSEKGPNHPSWRGGRYMDVHGYVMVFRSVEGAKSKWEHYVKEHVLVAEEALGRPLVEGEVVHHLDGDRANNMVHNLFVCSQRKHRDFHQSLQELGYSMFKKGLIVFDAEHGYQAHGKFRELLEQPGGANQQPSQSGDALEGSTTRRETHGVDNSPTSAGRGDKPCDDIV